ncbi:hypothetical protein V493_03911 [Pseudogymnoascus sp. VKM F-4281 (FW-2241)]|nr:hypothetical protein V493_03911 [Pseudogymnoascus sp. VKM F-4281 (FW-2241)]
MTAQNSVIFVVGPPGAGKGTLSAYLTKKFPVQHISVGDLLRRIKNNNTDPQAAALAYMLNKQRLIDGKVLVPILKTELEELASRDQRKSGILFAKSELVLFFNCPKEVAKQRYLTRNLEGRETDDEAVFEKRYEEYVQENGVIISQYAGRGLLLEISTSMAAEQSREELCKRLGKNDKWSKIIGS